MDNFLEDIRLAVEAVATDEAKQKGALACQAVLAVLDPKPVPAPAAEAAPPTLDPQQIAQMVGALRGVPVEQLLDLAISRLRSALPAQVSIPPVAPVRFQLLPVAHLAPVKR